MDGKYTVQAYRLWELARQLNNSGQTDASVEILKRVIAEFPNYAEAHNTLAWIYADKIGSQLQEAENLAKKAAALKPDKAHIYDTLGWVLYKRGKYVESTSNLEKAISLEDNNAEFFYHASLAYMQNRQQKKALKRLKTALTMDKSYSEVVKVEKAFDPIRNSSEFQAILTEVIKK